MTEYRVVFTVLGYVEAENETEARELVREGIENMPCVDYTDYRVHTAVPFEEVLIP